MRQLDYQRITAQAEAFKISVYTLIKREIGYRNITDREDLLNECCDYCKNLKKVKFNDTKEEKILCEIIGVMNDPHAEINLNCKCSFFERLRKGVNHGKTI